MGTENRGNETEKKMGEREGDETEKEMGQRKR